MVSETNFVHSSTLHPAENCMLLDPRYFELSAAAHAHSQQAQAQGGAASGLRGSLVVGQHTGSIGSSIQGNPNNMPGVSGLGGYRPLGFDRADDASEEEEEDSDDDDEDEEDDDAEEEEEEDEDAEYPMEEDDGEHEFEQYNGAGGMDDQEAGASA